MIIDHGCPLSAKKNQSHHTTTCLKDQFFMTLAWHEKRFRFWGDLLRSVFVLLLMFSLFIFRFYKQKGVSYPHLYILIEFSFHYLRDTFLSIDYFTKLNEIKCKNICSFFILMNIFHFMVGRRVRYRELMENLSEEGFSLHAMNSALTMSNDVSWKL